MPHWNVFGTLRFKLTLMYLLTFGVINTAMFLIVDWSREAELRKDFDATLLERAESILQVIETHVGRGPDVSVESLQIETLRDFVSPSVFIQIRLADGNGTIVWRSSNLGFRRLPFSETARMSLKAGKPIYETVTGVFAPTLATSSDSQIRLLTLYDGPDSASTLEFHLQVGRILDTLNQRIADFRRRMWGYLFGGFAVATFVSWVLARRSLAPIREITATAEEISVTNLDRRIQVPSGVDETARLAGVFNTMLERLQAAFSTQEQLLSNVSHELKTPVSVLLGEAQVLARKSAVPEEYQRFVSSVEEEMRGLQDIIESFLTLSRVESEWPRVALSEVSVNDMVMDAVRHSQSTAIQRDIRLVPILGIPGPDDSEPVVLGDTELLRVMVENVIRNAIKYSPAGAKVDIAVTIENPFVRIAIRDEGPGIPPRYLEKIFERAFQVPGMSDRRGSGLGLAIARGVARLHKGTIRAANRSDRGSEFTIELPQMTPHP